MWSHEFANTISIPFFETSAKGGRNVEAAFFRLDRDIKQRLSPSTSKDPSKNKPESITSKGADNHNKSKECCGIM